jgi:hypothetical protein
MTLGPALATQVTNHVEGSGPGQDVTRRPLPFHLGPCLTMKQQTSLVEDSLSVLLKTAQGE